MIFPGQSVFLKALGWTLLNSLWQLGLLWLVYIFIVSAGRKFSPSVRHGLALIHLSGGLLWFVASLIAGVFIYPEASEEPAGNLLNNSLYSSAFLQVKRFIEDHLSYLSIGYLLMTGVLFTRFFRIYYHSQRIQTRGLTRLGAELRMVVVQISEQLGIRKNVQVWASACIDTPMIIGFFKPTILIPLACINQLSVKQIEAILLHELAHVRRNDYLINLYISVVDIFFFFNPFAKLFIRSIKQERENSCDDWVLQFRFDPFQYASALLVLEQGRSQVLSVGVSASGDNKRTLLHRIQRIMNVKKPVAQFPSNIAAYALFVALTGLAALSLPGDEPLKATSKFNAINVYLSAAARQNRHYLINPPPVAASGKRQIKNTPPPVNSITPAESKTLTADDTDEYYLPLTEVALQQDEWIENINNSAAQIITADRDFSIPEKGRPELPAIAATSNDLFYVPYVPHSSFYYDRQEDTSRRKRKTVTYTDHVARESLIKAQKAVDEIDWDKIEKQFKGKTKVDIKKIKDQIQLSLQQLNWQKINREAKDSVAKENLDNMKASLKIEHDEMLKYKVLQEHFQQIRKNIELEEEKYKKGAELKFMDVQQKIGKKKTIVHI